MLFRRQFLAVAAASLTLVGAVNAALAEGTVTVFAAASLKNVLDAAKPGFEQESGKTLVISYAASGPLAKQIESGAPADVFVSADLKWMDYLDKAGQIDPASRTVLAGNSLVLIAPVDSTAAIDLAEGADLAGLLGDGRLAVGEPKSVPAGAYAVEALTALGILGTVEAKFAPVESVRAALALVATGEAAAGIVYATDAKVEPKVKVLATFPADSHKPIVYPAAVTKSSADPAGAAAFLAYVETGPGHAILLDQGFTDAK
ncbi:molybdate ABC transporter substrate-binding protein [Oharaeibacter diazotrophicus]|uniref:Molybdate transport system substrate-binding protein n=1 Tax=Oharaeibacter diazotrophicus TaxID=1920512 RepID=A0A4V3CV91_9HYPH|nr:molybdate ABC transporter substrate-binding protein [Oharaeibacter diazotrophicus]TDP81558.1 molybdate transport system substrate-binding protein [Oharaeibacter diazotrophicus]BBE73796.1 molybdate-binding periplasmic protein precursor [Pleomorphomonas sp. SM30]